MTDGGKSFQGLLNGIIRHDYYNETELTDDLLKQEVYKDLAAADFNLLITKTRNVIKSMATSDMDQNQAEIFLKSQTKKREGGITEDQAKVFLKLWKSHRNRIHESLIQMCNWNNQLKHLSWRIDVQSRSRRAEQVNTATAIIELQLEKKQDDSKDTEVLRFEVDENGLTQLLKSLKDVEDLIKNHTDV